MKSYEVIFRPRARKYLISLYRYIVSQSSPQIAASYIERMEQPCLKLSSLPQRGTMLPSRIPGLRSMGFERRATIPFCVEAETVEIVRILYRGRDLRPLIESLSTS